MKISKIKNIGENLRQERVNGTKASTMAFHGASLQLYVLIGQVGSRYLINISSTA